MRKTFFEGVAETNTRCEAVLAAEGAMASLREIPGRDVATRLAAHGRSPADLARAMIEDSPRLGSLGAVQVALSKWFSRGYQRGEPTGCDTFTGSL